MEGKIDLTKIRNGETIASNPRKNLDAKYTELKERLKRENPELKDTEMTTIVNKMEMMALVKYENGPRTPKT